MLIEHMGKGYSFESFGAVVKCNRDTLYNWTVLFSIFSDAKSQGELESLYFWEQLKRQSCVDRALNPTPIIYSMRCRFGKYGFNSAQSSGSDAGDDFDFK